MGSKLAEKALLPRIACKQHIELTMWSILLLLTSLFFLLEESMKQRMKPLTEYVSCDSLGQCVRNETVHPGDTVNQGLLTQ